MDSSIDPDSLPDVSFIVPAAGKGLRMGGGVAKQYLLVNGKPILQHTLERLVALQPGKIVLVVSADDKQWASIEATQRCCIVIGGETRSDSVLNGLNALDGEASDWVMVHDCVRPCVRAGDINRLYNDLKLSTVGGLLGLPVVETLKKVSDHRDVVKTVLREEHWLAQTPQMFRLGLLQSALQQAKSDAWNITDEASAIEMSGQTPIIIQGSKDNIKITTTEDLALAEYFLQQQSHEQSYEQS